MWTFFAEFFYRENMKKKLPSSYVDRIYLVSSLKALPLFKKKKSSKNSHAQLETIASQKVVRVRCANKLGRL